MKKYPARAVSETDRLIRLFENVFQEQLERLKRRRMSIVVPATGRLYEAEAGMAYHFKPELFIQTGGYTDFVVPGGHCLLKAGEICVMPKGVPHGEVVGNEPSNFEKRRHVSI